MFKKGSQNNPLSLEKIQDQLSKERASAHLKSKKFLQKSSHQVSKNRQKQQVSGPLLVYQTVIHNFTKEIRIRQELKVIQTENPVTTRRIKAPKVPPAPAIRKPPKPKQPSVEPVETLNQYTNNAPPVEEISQPLITKPKEEFRVYRLGDIHTGRRILMKHLGIDVGTKTIVIAYKDANDKVNYISEINGYWPFERSTPFIENMLNDPKKKRSDGTNRPARWFKLGDRAIVLGKDAEEFAYAKNDTMLRPMAEGGISPDEEAMTVLSSLVQGLMTMAETEVGKFGDEVKVCYCTTAPAINKESNVEYHERVVNLVIEGYETEADLTHENIKESHAIVIDMSEDGTGIGISWGAGTVTVSYVKYGLEVYSFCWVGAGDWIDEQVASRHGYDPDASKTRRKKAKETPTTVAKKKMGVELTPGFDYSSDRLALDIVLHYDVLINQVIDGIISGFEENEAEARVDDSINIFMAGGTSSPKGFTERVAAKFDDVDPPFEIGETSCSSKPLYCVAAGCLKASEMF